MRFSTVFTEKIQKKSLCRYPNRASTEALRSFYGYLNKRRNRHLFSLYCGNCAGNIITRDGHLSMLWGLQSYLESRDGWNSCHCNRHPHRTCNWWCRGLSHISLKSAFGRRCMPIARTFKSSLLQRWSAHLRQNGMTQIWNYITNGRWCREIPLLYRRDIFMIYAA